LTIPQDGESLVFVRRLGSYIATVLLALWLPATLHCEMETVGVFAESGTCHATSPGDAPTGDCDADGCAIIESGAFRSQTNIFFLKAPDLTRCLLLVVPPLEMTALPAIPFDRTTAPAEMIHTWQFVRRTAPPPRAPSFMA